MQNPIRKHLRSKRAASEPHLQQAVSGRAASSKKARPASKAQSRADNGKSPGRGRRQKAQEKPEPDQWKTALFTIQRESDGRWTWSAYDKFGLKVAYQDKCQDALQAFENIIAWHQEELTAEP